MDTTTETVLRKIQASNDEYVKHHGCAGMYLSPELRKEIDAALAALKQQPRHEGAEDARDAAMTFDEAVNCAWHVAGTTLHSREDIRAAVKAIWPLPVRQRDIAKRCPTCDGFGFKRDEGMKDGQD